MQQHQVAQGIGVDAKARRTRKSSSYRLILQPQKKKSIKESAGDLCRNPPLAEERDYLITPSHADLVYSKVTFTFNDGGTAVDDVMQDASTSA